MKQISTLLLALALPVCVCASTFKPVRSTDLLVKSTSKSRVSPTEATITPNAVAKTDAATTITCTGECSFEYYAETGDWYYGAVDDTKTYVVKLDYITKSEDKRDGTFTLSDLDTQYSAFLDYSSGSKVTLTYAEGTTFTVKVSDDDILSVTGTLVCSNGKTYTLAATHDLNAVYGNEYDMQDADVDVSFTAEETEVQQGDGYLYVECNNAKKETFGAVIFPNTNADGVGTYSITSGGAAGTIQPGDIDDSSVYPTFYATTDDDGYLNVPLFLCTAGTVEVAYDDANNIKLKVDATNTWGRKASIKVNWVAGVEDIIADADEAQRVEKVIENGRILIKKGDHKYNLLGVEVK